MARSFMSSSVFAIVFCTHTLLSIEPPRPPLNYMCTRSNHHAAGFYLPRRVERCLLLLAADALVVHWVHLVVHELARARVPAVVEVRAVAQRGCKKAGWMRCCKRGRLQGTTRRQGDDNVKESYGR